MDTEIIETTGSETPASDVTAPQAPEATTDGSKTTPQPSKQAIATWDKDERFEKMWKKDPNGLYKSYTELEKVYNPLKQQHEVMNKTVSEVVKVFQELGFDNPSVEDIKAVVSELKSWKDPSNPVVTNGNFLAEWLSDSEFQPAVVQFFKDLDARKMQRDFPNMTREQIEDMKKTKSELKSLKDEQQKTKWVSTLNETKEKMRKVSESKGYTLSDDDISNFFVECMNKGIEPDKAFWYFREKFDEVLDKAYADKIKQEQIQNLNKNKGSVIPQAAGNAPAPANKTMTSRERMLKAVTGG